MLSARHTICVSTVIPSMQRPHMLACFLRLIGTGSVVTCATDSCNPHAWVRLHDAAASCRQAPLLLAAAGLCTMCA